ncbi:MAG: alpha/beta fold hydrolase [Acidimicrobiia bacterium]
MAVARVNDTELFYEVDGGGGGRVACLVLHGGLGFDHQVYRRTLMPLADRLEVVWFDQRHNGRSGRPGLETVTMEQLADDAAALAGGLGHRRFLVFGHSYGGFVAQELAIRHPERVAGVILVSTTPGQLGAGEPEDDDQGPPPPPGLVEALSKLPTTDAELADGVQGLLPFYLHRLEADDVAPLLDGTHYDVEAMIRGFEVLATWSAVDRLPGVTCPVLLVAGRHDVLTSFPQSHRIARHLPAAEVVVVEETGHFPWIEAPDVFFATVDRWLDQREALPGA